MVGEHRVRAADRQVADVEMFRADRGQRADRARAHVFGGGAVGKIARQPVGRNRQETLQRLQRPRVGAAVEEDAEQARQRDAAPLRGRRRTARPGRRRDG